MNESGRKEGQGAPRIVPAAGEGLAEAAARLRTGRLVAFPTETVYGLGANALDPDAVAAIFAAKGRPASNPLIVHVADARDVAPLVRDWPEAAARLAAAFWPGPLTLVAPKLERIPDIVTAGGDTVAVRVPAHPAALALLRAAGVPVAAPSANRSEEVSPTTARHVADSLGPWVDDLLILDGGPTMVGIESTVVDATTAPVRILRPGMVTAAQIAAVVPVAEASPAAPAGDAPARSPGQRTRHYAPRAEVLIVPGAELAAIRRPGDAVLPLGDWPAAEYAARLYAALRERDAAGARRILIEKPPHGPEWAAIHDRLARAAAPKDDAR